MTIRLFLLLVATLLFGFTGVASAQVQDNIRINGFMTSAYAVSNSDVAYDQGRVDNEGTYFAYSRYGLQFSVDVNEDIGFLSQFIARGSDTSDRFGVDTDWAFIEYRATDSFSVRTGKVKASTYLMSQTNEVGYAYPWIKPPQNIYSDNYTAIPGTILSYTMEMADDMYLILSGGMVKNHIVDDASGIDIYSNAYPITVALEMDQLYVQVAQSSTTMDISGTVAIGANSINVAFEDVGLSTVAFGLNYDSDLFLTYLEYINYEFGEMGFISPAFNLILSYATLGIHLSDTITPHITTFQSIRKDDNGQPAYTEAEGNILGLRVELGESSCLKIEYHSIPRPEKINAASLVKPFTADPGKEVTLYMVALDVVF